MPLYTTILLAIIPTGVMKYNGVLKKMNCEHLLPLHDKLSDVYLQLGLLQGVLSGGMNFYLKVNPVTS